MDRVEILESRLAAIEQRLSRLEQGSAAESRLPGAAFEPSLREGLAADVSSHLGRVLLIFGGAYLLRAITDHQFVPTGAGILLGATYALFWLATANLQAADPHRKAIAGFYAGTSVFLAYPLIVEAISRFGLLSGLQGLAALALFFVLGFSVAVHRKFRSLAWLITAGGIVTSFAVIVLTHVAVPVAIFLLVLGLVTLWSAHRQHWPGLQWLGAAGANAGVVSLVVFGRSDQWTLTPQTAAVMASALLLCYLAAFAWRTHRRGESVGIFEVLQAASTTGIAALAAAGPVETTGTLTLGALSAALGASAYGLAFSPGTRRERGANFYFYTSLGLLLVLAGMALSLSPMQAAAAWSLLAVAMAWFSGRSGHVILSLQCTLLLLAAGIGSGILGSGLQSLAGQSADPWSALDPAYAGIALATVACLFLPVAQQSQRWGAAAGIPQLVVLALSVWEVGGLVVQSLAPILAGAGSPQPDPGVLAALRTAVLSIAAVTLALSSLHRRWPEARWIVYPVLFLVGVKLFFEDFPNGRPETLFVALAFVGGALLLVAKLSRLRKSLAPAIE